MTRRHRRVWCASIAVAVLSAGPVFAQEAPSIGVAPPPAELGVPPGFITFEARPTVTVGDDGQALHWEDVPLQEPGHVPLQGRAIYDALGRRDLGDAYDARATAKTVLLVGGVALILGSGIAAAAEASPGPSCDVNSSFDTFSRCVQSQGQTQVGALPIVLASAGALASLVGLILPADPLSRGELGKLVQQHNARLAAGAGSSPAPSDASVAVSPVLFNGGGGLGLTGRF
jgi:hypothetical protein